jgi:cyclopropane fatty-acyl-phospholipid synthase-like methyltransferase
MMTRQELRSMSELERWETRFSAPGYLFGTEPNAFLKNQAHRLRKGQKALAIGDGEGRNGVWLAEQGLVVHSIDFSPTAVAKAGQLAKARGVTVTTELADVTQWKWPTAAFDVVVAIFIQFTTPADRPRVFSGIRQALKPGGLLLLEGYGPRQLEYKTGGPPEIDRLYTRDLLLQAFAGFASLEVREYDAELREGAHHVGMSALVDLVAVK